MGQGVREMKTRGAGELEPVQYSKGLLLGAARFHVAARSAPSRPAPPGAPTVLLTTLYTWARDVSCSTPSPPPPGHKMVLPLG